MIKIIIDKHKLSDEKADISVIDDKTYVKSRLLIDEVKNEKRKDITILVSRSSYINYYSDLYDIPGWIEIIEFNLLKIIESYGLSFTGKEIERLKYYIKEKNIINFLDSYNNSTSLELNILNYIFDIDEEIIEVHSYEDLIGMIEGFIEGNRTSWDNYKYKELIKESLNTNLNRKIIRRIFTVSTIDDLNKLKSSLVATYLFSNYPQSSKNLIKSKAEVFDSVFVSEKYVSEILSMSNGIIEKLDFTLSSVKEKLSIFEKKNLDEFLSCTKGYLEEEWRWVWGYLKTSFGKEKYEEDLLKIKLWAKKKKAKQNIDILERLVIYKEERVALRTPKNIDEWYHYYKYFYLKWFSSMDDDKNIINKLKEINDGFLDESINEIKEYNDCINNKYIDFLYKNYETLLQEKECNIEVIRSIENYVENNKVLFFIIDGCRWETWEVVKSLFEENGYYIENEKQFCLSAIPSITSVSRTSLVTGKSFHRLASEKLDKEFSFDILNEEKHIKQAYPKKNVIFKKGNINDLEALLEYSSDIYVFIYTEEDAILHVAESMTLEASEALLRNLINGIIKTTKNYEDLLILFGTDHGSIKNEGEEKLSLDILPSMNINQHGNSIMLSSFVFNNEEFVQIKGKIDVNKFYCIWREDLYKYGLPKRMYKEEVYAWIFPKWNCYYGRKPKGYNHGGFSMEETIIPYGVFRKQQEQYIELMIEEKDKRLSIDGISYVEFIIYNPNKFMIKKIVFELPSVGAKSIVNDLPSKGKEKIKIQFKIDSDKVKNDEFKETIKININYLNENTEQKLVLVEKVEIKTVIAINKDISKKRTLDF